MSNIQEGHIAVTGGNVWYRIVGAEKKGTPLITLHGGPGFPHDYLESLEALADERPVVFYDQLGCGNSDRPDDVSLWTVERFVQELGQLRAALHLDRAHLLGQSWGTILTMDYLLTKPKGIASVIFASGCFSIPRFAADARMLLQGMPAEIREIIERNEAAGTFDSEEYQGAVFAFYAKHVCRLDPWPDSLMASLGGLGQQVYGTMWGASEFTINGSLATYDRTNRLGELNVPILYTCGRYDEVTPEASAAYQQITPRSRLVVFENSAHMAHLEERELYLNTVREFLHEAEAR